MAKWYVIANKNTPIPNGQGNFKQVKDSYIHGNKVIYRGHGENDQVGVYARATAWLEIIKKQYLFLNDNQVH